MLAYICASGCTRVMSIVVVTVIVKENVKMEVFWVLLVLVRAVMTTLVDVNLGTSIVVMDVCAGGCVWWSDLPGMEDSCGSMGPTTRKTSMDCLLVEDPDSLSGTSPVWHRLGGRPSAVLHLSAPTLLASHVIEEVVTPSCLEDLHPRSGPIHGDIWQWQNVQLAPQSLPVVV